MGKNKALKIILSPYFAVVGAAAYLERFSITFVLSVAFAVVFPHIFNILFPVLDYLDQLMY